MIHKLSRSLSDLPQPIKRPSSTDHLQTPYHKTSQLSHHNPKTITPTAIRKPNTAPARPPSLPAAAPVKAAGPFPVTVLVPLGITGVFVAVRKVLVWKELVALRNGFGTLLPEGAMIVGMEDLLAVEGGLGASVGMAVQGKV